MKKRNFIKNIGLAAFASLIDLNVEYKYLIGSKRNELPKYWVWMRPQMGLSDEEWKSIFRELSAAGIEAVLPQIYSSNETLFEIEGYTVKEKWLERIIPIAHSEKIQIHAWMWTMPCNDPNIINQHPEWYVVNRKGESASSAPAYVPYYKFLCPRRPEVRTFVQNRVKVLASIPNLDGIHLDYVRMPDVILAEGLQPKYNIIQNYEFPEYDYCYCSYCRDSYKTKSGIDPIEIEDPENDKEWYQFRYDAVNEMVNQFLVPEARKNNKKITAAVFPNWESVRQQWHHWDLDGFLPMLYHQFYNKDYNWIAEEVKKSKARLKNNKPVFTGMFLPHFENNEMEKAFALAKESGADGFALFDYSSLKKEDFKTMMRITNKF